jgi:tripartite-type tricarboxylate transporter receptor subunit TctC
MRRIIALSLFMVFCFACASLAADFPVKAIQMVVPWKPGGGSDISARIVGEYAKEALGQPIVISNIDGAAGLVAAGNVNKARPDGYTLLWEHAGNLTVAPLITKAAYRWNDFRLICSIGQSDIVLVTGAKSPWKDAKDAFKEIKANPGKVRWSMALNAVSHLTFLDIADKAGGLDVMAIPAQGDKGRIVSILGGNSDISTVGYAAADPYVQSGDLKILGMATKKRSPFAKDIPTLKEQGYDAGSVYLYTVFAPKGTPDDVAKKLEDAFRETMARPEVAEKLAQQSISVNFMESRAASAYWQEEANLYERLAKANNLVK